jgi:hypothetical protein
MLCISSFVPFICMQLYIVIFNFHISPQHNVVITLTRGQGLNKIKTISACHGTVNNTFQRSEQDLWSKGGPSYYCFHVYYCSCLIQNPQLFPLKKNPQLFKWWFHFFISFHIFLLHFKFYMNIELLIIYHSYFCWDFFSIYIFFNYTIQHRCL